MTSATPIFGLVFQHDNVGMCRRFNPVPVGDAISETCSDSSPHVAARWNQVAGPATYFPWRRVMGFAVGVNNSYGITLGWFRRNFYRSRTIGSRWGFRWKTRPPSDRLCNPRPSLAPAQRCACRS